MIFSLSRESELLKFCFQASIALSAMMPNGNTSQTMLPISHLAAGRLVSLCFVGVGLSAFVLRTNPQSRATRQARHCNPRRTGITGRAHERPVSLTRGRFFMR
ncbi:MAG TPA: hypothetical protein DD473_01705 [Planctomycetaceae bacterium]|mgnify:CR=1 FL=1|nr:hypothetical protein [Planctomycetaceae bacterium]